MTATLLEPVTFGELSLPNRIVMAPMTRARSGRSGVPPAIVAQYYAQRATAGLIITEATGISVEGSGWPNAPGIWSQEQVEGWRAVTDAVHGEGGLIACQLWHMGRLVHSSFLDGEPPVSASATRCDEMAHTYAGKAPYDTARAMTVEDIGRTLDDYEQAARNAKAAGFDAVQLHGANGYLVDQFLRDGTNLRDDDYGGSIPNRCRFLREVVERLVAVWGAGRVSVRLSPNDDIQGCADTDRDALFTEAVRVLNSFDLAFLEMRAPGPQGTFGQGQAPFMDEPIRRLFASALVLNADYDATRAQAALAEDRCDAIAFGRPFIANPDLVTRIAAGAAWSERGMDPKTWYGPGPEGYVDFPAMATPEPSSAG